jgi:pyrroloquinoline quinone (PQQ) biosynthesis protein C
VTGLEVDPWARLGLPDDALEFFRVSSQADVGHGNETVEILARHTTPGREDEVVATLVDTIARLRHMMDGLWALAAQLDGGEDRP